MKHRHSFRVVNFEAIKAHVMLVSVGGNQVYGNQHPDRRGYKVRVAVRSSNQIKQLFRPLSRGELNQLRAITALRERPEA